MDRLPCISDLDEGAVLVFAGAFDGESIASRISNFSGTSYCLEPNRDMFLKCKKRLVNFSGVVLRRQALWHVKDVLPFHLVPGKPVSSSLFNRKGQSIEYSVKTISLSDIVAEAGKISLLSMDIEGAEHKVLKHMDDQLARNVLAMEIELHPDLWEHGSSQGLLKTAKRLGYSGKILSIESRRPEMHLWR